MYGLCDDFDTYYDEIHIYNDRIVILKTFLNMELSLGRKNTFLTVSDTKGHLLWKINTNPVTFDLFIHQHPHEFCTLAPVQCRRETLLESHVR